MIVDLNEYRRRKEVERELKDYAHIQECWDSLKKRGWYKSKERDLESSSWGINCSIISAERDRATHEWWTYLQEKLIWAGVIRKAKRQTENLGDDHASL